MSWIPNTPLRADFCAHPPCPLCFHWEDEDETHTCVDALVRIALDLLGKSFDALTTEELTGLQELTNQLHSGALNLLNLPDAPPLQDVDIGMSEQEHLTRWLAQRREIPAPTKPQPTCDEIAARGKSDATPTQEKKQKAPAMLPAPDFRALRERGVPPSFILWEWEWEMPPPD